MTNAESSTPATGVLAVKDQAGNYYLIPQPTLEQCRVPAEHTADLEQFMTAAIDQGGAHGEDVHGHSPVAAGIAAACIIYTGFSLAFDYVTSVRGPTPSPAPTIEFPPSQEPVRGPGGRPA